jgi:RHS repeat-associated protein
VTRRFGHFPYGETWYESTGTNKWKFTTYERDSSSGEANLDYASFRSYSSAQGRFASPDLLAGDIGAPQTLNRYAYSLNDPVNFDDPLGLHTECTTVTFLDGSGNPVGSETKCIEVDDGPGGGSAGGGDDGGGLPTDPCGGKPCGSGGGSGGGGGSDADRKKKEDCKKGLQKARANKQALDRVNQNWDTIEKAADKHSVDPALLGAIAIRESQGKATAVQSGGLGRGMFQIDLGAHKNVSTEQAFNVEWSANYAASLLESREDHYDDRGISNEMSQSAAIRDYNTGPKYTSGKIPGGVPALDRGTANGNYVSDVLLLMNCF